MIWRRIILLAARLVFVGFFLLTSLFCLLAYVPFTYQQVHKGGLLPWLNTFGRIHVYLYGLALLLALPILLLDRPRRESRDRIAWLLRIGFLAVHGSAGVFLLLHPVLRAPENSLGSYLWGIAALVPIVWLSVIDWRDYYGGVQWLDRKSDEERYVFRAAWRSALFLTVSYAAIVFVKGQFGAWSFSAELFAVSISGLSHLLAFMLFFVMLNLLAVVASWFGHPPRAQFLLCHVLGASILWMVFHSLVFPAMSFSTVYADIYAACFAAANTCFAAALCLRGHRNADTQVASGLALSLGFSGQPAGGWRRIAVSAIVVAGVACWLGLSTARLDWNYLLQKLTAVLIWVVTFRLFYVTGSRSSAAVSRAGTVLFAALLVLPFYRTLEVTERAIWKSIGNPGNVSEFLDRYAGYDVSFKLLHDALAVGHRDGGFYRFLTQNTNIPRSTPVAPVPVNLVEALAPSPGERPNIFVFVVDSMRRDYLSPYNAAVDFTPEVGQFARESVVIVNAFTRYGGTGLSEPSIWVGGMMLHKQYVTPFAPMNALQKLIETEKYRSFVTRDTILTTVVAPSPLLTELDENTANMSYDFCASLSELETKLAAEPPGPPLFAYTQPQNIHISVINREGGKAISNEDYHGFYAPYASRLRRIDGCFGKFIGFLKARGIYDKSIVVLTADHGDSLGEQGRWGHAYTIYPEILRIPLIIHLPPAMRQLYSNPKELTFSTDITPSLYYLTGHKPIVQNELFGRPLFTERPEEQTVYRRDTYLVASSYAAVYGILSDRGRKLYVSDGVNYKDYAFDLSSATPSAESVSSSMETANQKLIREKILSLDKFYGFAVPGAAQK